MCGIAAWILANSELQKRKNELDEAAKKIQHRGPDRSITVFSDNARLDFHRLCINGLDSDSDQPFEVGEWILICNGEIYNHKLLSERFPTKSKSDCEVIVSMLNHGLKVNEVCMQLDGVFAFFAINPKKKVAVAGRDLFGVRGLYYSHEDTSFSVASELKCLHHASTDTIRVFPPNTWMAIDYSNMENIQMEYGLFWTPFTLDSYRPIFTNEDRALRAIRNTLRSGVKKRLMADRLPIGCFLSGGLDSSIVAALIVENMKNPKDLYTFSIGMEGSTDLHNARIVADYLGTTHHEILVTEDDMLNALPEALKSMETFDTTTVRAGTGMWLLSKWIYNNTNVRVIFSGEGSDELSGSYLYFRNAPSLEEYHKECIRLCDDLHRYDVLRADKATAAHGLEVRVPFLDREFTNIYLRVDSSLRSPRGDKKIEKYLLRKAFEYILPPTIVWRVKEAFSDGVSSQKKSWFQIIQDHVRETIEEEELNGYESLEYLPTSIPESQWYRHMFQTYYPGRDKIIPYYWLPKWSGDVKDPSARVLETYDS